MTGQEWFRVGAILTLLTLGMPLLRWLGGRFNGGPEITRKSLHVLMGLGCASFPWIFERSLPVWTLALCATLPLLAVRFIPVLRTGVGEVLHGVGRISYGDILFAPAVATVFQLSLGHPFLHLIPILILAVADASGAVFGTRWGKRFYIAGQGSKTIEGSSMFLVTAFACVCLPLLISGRVELTEALLISAIVATLAMMGEGFSDRGFDNLVLPIGCHFVLARIIDLDASPLFIRLVVLAAILALVLTGSRWSTLSGGALLGSALLGYGCAVIGGWKMALPPSAVFVCHVVITRKHALTQVFKHRLDAVLSHAIAAMPWAVLVGRDAISSETGLAGISFAMAAQLAMLDSATRLHVNGLSARPIRSVGKGWCFAALPGLVWLYPYFPNLAIPAMISAMICLLSTLIYQRIRSLDEDWPTALWIVKGTLAFASSTPALLFR